MRQTIFFYCQCLLKWFDYNYLNHIWIIFSQLRLSLGAYEVTACQSWWSWFAWLRKLDNSMSYCKLRGTCLHFRWRDPYWSCAEQAFYWMWQFSTFIISYSTKQISFVDWCQWNSNYTMSKRFGAFSYTEYNLEYDKNFHLKPSFIYIWYFN